MKTPSIRKSLIDTYTGIDEAFVTWAEVRTEKQIRECILKHVYPHYCSDKLFQRFCEYYGISTSALSVTAIAERDKITLSRVYQSINKGMRYACGFIYKDIPIARRRGSLNTALEYTGCLLDDTVGYLNGHDEIVKEALLSLSYHELNDAGYRYVQTISKPIYAKLFKCFYGIGYHRMDFSNIAFQFNIVEPEAKAILKTTLRGFIVYIATTVQKDQIQTLRFYLQAIADYNKPETLNDTYQITR